MSKLFDWMSAPQYLAQVGHTLAGILIVFAAGVFFHAQVLALVLGLVAAALKEFLFDVAPWGEGDSWSDSIMDFGFYAAGGLAGFGLALLQSHLLTRACS